MPTYLREDEEHRRVAEAVASGDAGGAADLFREHIVGFEEQFVRAFGHRSAEEEMGD
jgi:DNA-binding GntR family transcriptional regulator